MKWSKEVNRYGRPVYRCRVPYGTGQLLVGSVVDYNPATPPYHALVRTPLIQDKWFEQLEEAKQYIVATYTLAVMDGDMKFPK